jgi:hypothetical protein
MTARTLRLFVATVTLWCLGCDAYEQIAESAAAMLSPVRHSTGEEPRAQRVAGYGTVEVDAGAVAGDSCHCALGHAAVLSAASALPTPTVPVTPSVAPPSAALLPAPEPPLRPPVV